MYLDKYVYIYIYIYKYVFIYIYINIYAYILFIIVDNHIQLVARWGYKATYN